VERRGEESFYKYIETQNTHFHACCPLTSRETAKVLVKVRNMLHDGDVSNLQSSMEYLTISTVIRHRAPGPEAEGGGAGAPPKGGRKAPPPASKLATHKQPQRRGVRPEAEGG
jgi:hypothetical protein